LFGGTVALTSRQPDPEKEEVGRLQTKVSDLTMTVELVREKIATLGAGQPLPPQRPRS
jgi:archaellum component FlaC